MKRITLNAMVDFAALVFFIPSLISGIVLFVFLPSGGGRGGGRAYLEISRDQWITMHNGSSFIFAGLIIIHLVLHWKFYRNINKTLVPREK